MALEIGYDKPLSVTVDAYVVRMTSKDTCSTYWWFLVAVSTKGMNGPWGRNTFPEVTKKRSVLDSSTFMFLQYVPPNYIETNIPIPIWFQDSQEIG